MTPEEIKNSLTEIFKDVFDDESIALTSETTADDIDEWDSLSQITLLVAIEKEFKITLTFVEVQNLKNVGDMLDLIATKVA
jgi:acyl carrier protein